MKQITPLRFKEIPVLQAATLEHTPIGPIGVAVSEIGLVSVSFRPAVDMPTWRSADSPGSSALLDQALAELEEYLCGQRRVFTIPIDWRGLRPFQTQVLQMTAEIPFGELRTYGELARAAGRPGGAIAVGGIMAGNPMPLVVPCHRVVGSDRRLHGFGAPGGIKTKRYLLELEGHRFVAEKLA